MDVGDSGSESVLVEVAEDVVLESAEAVVASPAAAAGSAAHPYPSVALGAAVPSNSCAGPPGAPDLSADDVKTFRASRFLFTYFAAVCRCCLDSSAIVCCGLAATDNAAVPAAHLPCFVSPFSFFISEGAGTRVDGLVAEVFCGC